MALDLWDSHALDQLNVIAVAVALKIRINSILISILITRKMGPKKMNVPYLLLCLRL